jgi:5-formyltetrahydrofolate cyclo-ligase
MRWDDLLSGTYGILEPSGSNGNEVESAALDLIIVPGVVFDRRGNRIGHGKGYYDQLLRKTSTIISIGLLFECQLVNYIPVEEHDVRVRKIITEKRVLDCED